MTGFLLTYFWGVWYNPGDNLIMLFRGSRSVQGRLLNKIIG